MNFPIFVKPLRGSYSMFSSQLGNGSSGLLGVVQYRYIEFNARDLNGDKIAQPNEATSGVVAWSGFNINNPSDVSKSINQVGDYHVPKTHEFIAGIDRELFTNFGVSASFTYRRFVNFNWSPRIGVRADDYVQAGVFTAGSLPDGSTPSVPYYKVDPSRLDPAALDGGSEYTGRDGYHQRYWGVEVSATKRLSNRWMARVGFSTNDHRQYWDNPNTSIQDPARAASISCCPGTSSLPTACTRDRGASIWAQTW